MSSVRDVARGLISAADRRSTLLKLLRLQSRGDNIAPEAVDIVRYCLESSSVRENGILPLSLELLSVQPDHSAWEIVIRVLAKLLGDTNATMVHVTLDKSIQLPQPILRAFVYKGGAAVAKLAKDGSPGVKMAATKLCAHVCYRSVPLTKTPAPLQLGFTPETDVILATQAGESELVSILSSMRSALDSALSDPDEEVVAEILKASVPFATQSSERGPTPGSSDASTPKTEVLSSLFRSVNSISGRLESMQIVNMRACVSSLLQLAAFVLKDPSSEKLRKDWSVKFLDGPISSFISGGSPAISLMAAAGTAHVCNVTHESYRDLTKRAEMRALPALLRIADDSKLSPDQRGAAARNAVALLQTVQKTHKGERTVLTSLAQLFPVCSTITPTHDRLRCLINLCQLLFKLDCIDNVDPAAPAAKSVLDSGFIKGFLEVAPARPVFPAEVVCGFCSSSLRMIRYVVANKPNRMKVLEAWFNVVAMILGRMFKVLSWSKETPEVLLAKEYLLRVFEMAIEVDRFFFKYRNMRNPYLIGVQQELISLMTYQENPRIKALSVLSATYCCSEDIINSDDNGKQLLKALWSFLKGGFQDKQIAKKNLDKGTLWVPMSTTTTLKSDNVYQAELAIRSLVQRVPRASTRTTQMLERYLEVLEEAREYDSVADDLVRTSIKVLASFDQPNHPTPVEVKTLASFANAPTPDPLSFLLPLADALIAASSRISPRTEQRTLAQLEALVLQDDGVVNADITTGSRGNVRSSASKKTIWNGKGVEIEANHATDLSRKLILLRLVVRNLTNEAITNFRITSEVIGSGLVCISSKSEISYLPKQAERLRGFTLDLVQEEQPGDGVVEMSFGCETKEGEVEGDCDPYPISPYDFNFLVSPPRGVFGLGVWRRRWDLCTSGKKIYAYLRKEQTVDALLEEMQSLVLQQVGRLRSQTQFAALVCSSTSGSYLLAAVYAPEADRGAGHGPCIVHIDLRSESATLLNMIGRHLQDRFASKSIRVLSDQEAFESEKTKQYGSFFVADGQGMNVHQRWREAHRARLHV